jgi:hypothetical protein
MEYHASNQGEPGRKKDSDMTDSDNTVDFVKMVDFSPVAAQPAAPKPPLTKEEDAVEHVKHALLKVDRRRSTTDLEATLTCSCRASACIL